MSLVLSGVGKTYQSFRKAPVEAVKNLDMAVDRGETVALLGSSGCGKTSTLRMVAGFESVTTGTITLAGRRIDSLAPAKRHVAMAFEGYALYPPLTVGENIGFALRGSRTARRDVEKRVHDVSALLEIESILARRPAGLSGGQQQRASLARALVRDADLHLLDEPMSQLEPQLRAILRGRVKALLKERQITAVFVTHDQTEANALADRIAVMEDGVLQQFGPPEQLRERPANLFVATFLGEPPMNAVSGSIETGGIRMSIGDGLGMWLALPDAHVLVAGRNVVLGVRPYRIRLGSGSWLGRVVSNQWLGDEAHVAFEVGQQMMVAVSHTRVPVRVNDELPFGFDAADIHLFDAETGQALLHGGQPV